MNNKSHFYLPEVDIIRFFAFFAVFIHHALPQTIEAYQGVSLPIAKILVSIVLSGRFGVDLFFALSAFLITELLIREFEKTGKINATAFYFRRILRIFPLYYAFVLITMFILHYLLENESLPYPYNVSFLFFAANWTITYLGFPQSVAVPLWSVSVEEQFYLVFPFLVMWLKPRNLLKLAGAFILIAFMTRFYLAMINSTGEAVFCNTFARLDSIAVGIILAILLRNEKLKFVQSMRIRACLIALGVFLIIGVTFILFNYYLNEISVYAAVLCPVAAFSSLLIIWGALRGSELKGKIYRLFIYLGKISYGLYVFHVLCLRIVSNLIMGSNMKHLTFWWFIGSLLLTVLISVLSYEIYEKYFLKLKRTLSVIQSHPV